MPKKNNPGCGVCDPGTPDGWCVSSGFPLEPRQEWQDDFNNNDIDFPLLPDDDQNVFIAERNQRLEIDARLVRGQFPSDANVAGVRMGFDWELHSNWLCQVRMVGVTNPSFIGSISGAHPGHCGLIVGWGPTGVGEWVTLSVDTRRFPFENPAGPWPKDLWSFGSGGTTGVAQAVNQGDKLSILGRSNYPVDFSFDVDFYVNSTLMFTKPSILSTAFISWCFKPLWNVYCYHTFPFSFPPNGDRALFDDGYSKVDFEGSV